MGISILCRCLGLSGTKVALPSKSWNSHNQGYGLIKGLFKIGMIVYQLINGVPLIPEHLNPIARSDAAK